MANHQSVRSVRSVDHSLFVLLLPVCVFVWHVPLHNRQMSCLKDAGARVEESCAVPCVSAPASLERMVVGRPEPGYHLVDGESLLHERLGRARCQRDAAGIVDVARAERVEE